MVPSPKFFQGLTTLIVKNIFLHVPIEQVRFHFTGPVNSIPVLIFFFFVLLPPALISPSPTFLSCSLFRSMADLVLLPSVKEGIFTLLDYFRGSLQTWGMAASLKKFMVLIVWVILLSSSLSTPCVLWNLTANISADHV